MYQSTVSYLVAEVGFFIVLSRILIRKFLPFMIACATPLVKNTAPWRFLLRYPRPPAEVVVAIQNPLHRAKEEGSPFGLPSSFGCGGGI